MMNTKHIIAVLVVSLVAAVPAWAGSNKSSTTPHSNAKCAAMNQTIQDAKNYYNKNTGESMKAYTQPRPLGIVSCVKSLLNIGTGLGVPTISAQSLGRILEEKACNAAKSYERQQFNRLNQALPSINGRQASMHQGSGNNFYKESQTNNAVNKIWNALN